MGPVGSGKSVYCITKLLKIAHEQEPSKYDNIRYTKFGIVRNTFEQLKKTTLATIKGILDEDSPSIRYKVSPPMSVIFHLDPVPAKVSKDGVGVPGINMEFNFFAMDKEKQARDFLSYECTGMFVNEAREMDEDIVSDAFSRTGRYPSMAKGGAECTQSVCLLDTNPPGKSNYIYRWFANKVFGVTFYFQPPGVLEMKYLHEEGVYISITLENRDYVIPESQANTRILKEHDKYWAVNPRAENLVHLPVDKALDDICFARENRINENLFKRWATNKSLYEDSMRDEIKALPFTYDKLVARYEKRGKGDLLGLGSYYLRNLSTSSLPKIRSMYQGKFTEVFTGKPVISTFSREHHVTNDFKLFPHIPVIAGMDIGGGTLHPAIVFAQRAPQGPLIICGEITGDEMGAEDFITAIKYWLSLNNVKLERIWADPAGSVRDPIYAKQTINYFNKSGLRTTVTKDNAISVRINAINNRLSRTHTSKMIPGLIISKKCSTLIDGLAGGWKYEKKANKTVGGDIYKDTPDKGPYSHPCDALGYLCAGITNNNVIEIDGDFIQIESAKRRAPLHLRRRVR